MSFTAGSRLGPYEIVAPIGAGGMGEVFRARDTRLDRSVAIKVLPSHLSSDPQLRERFDREARAISALNHPNICTLHDVGQQNGISYIVMELLEGESLADRLARGPLAIPETLEYGAQIAAGLDKAHRHGVVHRDLKPANVVITKSGAKLLDFGLAKMAASAFVMDAPTEQQKPLTAEGTILGTFQYMAPEQLEGLEADARTDIFSFGAVLYEMVTGRRAFEGKTKTSLIAAIVDRDPPPVTSVQPFSPPALERLIRTCLAKDPEERWQSARDVLLQLRAIASSSAEAAVAIPARGRWRRERIAWLVAAVAATATIAAFVVTRRAPAPPAQPFYASLAPPSGSEFLLSGPHTGAITISPDSRLMTFVAPAEDGIQRLWVRELHSGRSHALAGTERAQYPFWSPDSRQIGFFVNRKLRTISAEGGPSVDVCTVREPRGGTWGPDGTILFTPHWRDPIFKVAATGGEPVAVTTVNAARNETTHRWPLFLPDGRHFLYFAGSHTSAETSGDNAIYLGSLDGGEPRLLLRARSNVAYAAGYLLFLREQKLVAQKFDTESLQILGQPIPIADGVRYEKGFFQAVFAASDSVLIYQTGGSETRSVLNWVDRAGENIGTLAPANIYFDLEISPDGRSAAVAVGDPSDIWIFDLGRGVRSRLTSDPWGENSVLWAPDSKSVLYDNDRNVQADVFRQTVGPAPETVVLADPDVHEKPLDFSRDGRFMVVSHARADATSGSDLWIHPTAPAAKPFAYVATPFEEWDARLSPDSSFVAYVSNESGRDEVYVATFPEPAGKWVISTEGGSAPRWRGDGRELFYVAPNGAIVSVPIVSDEPFTAGTAKTLFRIPIFFGPEASYDVTADGQRFLVSQPEPKQEEPVTVVVNWTSRLPD